MPIANKKQRQITAQWIENFEAALDQMRQSAERDIEMYPLFSAQRDSYETQIEVMRSDVDEWDKRQDKFKRGRKAGDA